MSESSDVQREDAAVPASARHTVQPVDDEDDMPDMRVIHVLSSGRCGSCGAICPHCLVTDESRHPGRHFSGEGETT